MAVRMRLMRMGKTKSPVYRVVVMDGRAPRDGRYIDQIGRYDPRQDPSVVEIDTEKAVDWLRKGAQPSDPVRKLLEISGAWARYKVATGKVHTVAAKTPPSPQPVAEMASATEPAVSEASATEAAGESGPEEIAGGEEES
jgi:small subunit ribosomal protein S16